MILLLLSIISAVSCQQPKMPAENATDNTSLQTVYEIPEGTEPQRAETYDDIVSCGPGLVGYRASCGMPKEKRPDYIKEAEVTLSGCQFAPRVTYRDNIETEAAKIRYNIFYVQLLDESLRELNMRQRRLTKTWLVDYDIKLAGTVPDIQVINVGVWYMGLGNFTGDVQFHLMIEISPQVKPGDYTLHFIVDANGQNCGELPCVIHVLAPGEEGTVHATPKEEETSTYTGNQNKETSGLTLYEFYNTGDDGLHGIWGKHRSAQTFTPLVSHTIKAVKLKLAKGGYIGHDLTVTIKATDADGAPSGDDLCFGTISNRLVTDNLDGRWNVISMGEGYPLSAGTKYAIVARYPEITGSSMEWRGNYNDATYNRGDLYESTDKGLTWQKGQGILMFEEWGIPTPTIPDEK